MPRASSFLALSVAASRRAMVSLHRDHLLLAGGQAGDAEHVDHRAGIGDVAHYSREQGDEQRGGFL